MHLFETVAYSIWLPADRVALLCMFSLCEDRRAFVATVRQHLFLFYLFLKRHHETRRPRCKSLGTGRRCSAGHRKRLCDFAVWRKRSMRRHRISFGGKFEPFIKVFEVEQRRRRRCVVPFRGHWEVVFPRACAFASLQYRRHPEWAWKAIIMSAVVVSLWDRSPKLCSSHYQRLSTSIHYFPASRWIQGEQWHAGLGVCNCAFLYMFTGTTSYRCAAHLTRHSCVDFSSCHMVWDLKLIYIPLQGGLCSLIYEIELASSFCSCSVITCTAAGEELYATWLFDNELSIATHS